MSKADRFGFKAKIQAFQVLKNSLPPELGTEAVNFFQSSFRDQGFKDNALNKWKEVQRRTPGTKTYKSASPADRSRAILVKSGRLKRSIRRGFTSFAKTVIATDVPYAKVHNQGSTKMPKRQFMGSSKQLDTKLMTIIRKRVSGIMK